MSVDNLSKNPLTVKELEICLQQDFYWDALIVKKSILLFWVKIFVHHKSGNFISTKQLFKTYKYFSVSGSLKSKILPAVKSSILNRTERSGCSAPVRSNRMLCIKIFDFKGLRGGLEHEIYQLLFYRKLLFIKRFF